MKKLIAALLFLPALCFAQALHIDLERYAQNGKKSYCASSDSVYMELIEAHLGNGSGSAINLATSALFPDSAYKAGQVTAASTPDYVDDTTDCQSAATGDCQLFSTTNNDGNIQQAPYKFGYAGYTISQGQTGSPVYVLKYYNGSSMATLPTLECVSTFSTGDKFCLFLPPEDWALGSTAAVGCDSDKYCIEWVATTAPTQAVLADRVWVASLISVSTSAANGTTAILEPKEPHRLRYKECIMPIFGGTASNGNFLNLWYKEVK